MNICWMVVFGRGREGHCAVVLIWNKKDQLLLWSGQPTSCFYGQPKLPFRWCRLPVMEEVEMLITRERNINRPVFHKDDPCRGGGWRGDWGHSLPYFDRASKYPRSHYWNCIWIISLGSVQLVMPSRSQEYSSICVSGWMIMICWEIGVILIDPLCFLETRFRSFLPERPVLFLGK